MAHKAIPQEVARGVVHGSWKKVMEATTPHAMIEEWENFKNGFWGRNSKLIEYLDRECLEHKEKWACAYTNNIFHIGNTSTNRVESAHSTLKAWLNTSTGGVDTLFLSWHASIGGQVIEIRKELETCRTKTFKGAYGPPYGVIRGSVSLYALELMFVEGKKTPSECDCVIGRTHGLPCSCRINSFKGAGDHFQITHLAPFWSTLDYANPHDARRFEDNDANDLQIFHDLVAEVCRRGPSAVRAAKVALMSQLYPEEEGLREPRVSTKAKGRPPKRENARDPSWHEHAAARQGRRSTRSKTSTSDVTGGPKDATIHKKRKATTSDDTCAPKDATIHKKRKTTTSDVTGGPKRDPMTKIDGVNVFPYFRFVPESVRDRCLGWWDPAPDGHCGFRALSHALYGDEDHHLWVRKAIIDEVMSIQQCEYAYEDVGLALTRLQWNKPEGTTMDHWMTESDLAVVAKLFNWAIILYSQIDETKDGVRRRVPFGQTFLPMIAKPGVARPSTGNHWVRLDFDEDSIPMPPFTFPWTHFRDKMSTQGWEELFKDERDLYFALGGHHD
ncbi:unnamed protein product [Linum tenue]|uniref:Protein FAR1-RELATED SEQUENCE n=1 Tax=Linum tenue TaxID=586396 RepID=A0AAV0NMM8_9ROSI|nr:unnamed protein product [Linum tenue]